MFDKKYLQRVALYIGGAILAIGLAFYIGYHLWQSVTREIETVPAIPETFSVTAEYDAWIFRDEEVISVSSTGEGTVVPSVRDGEKVAALDVVANVYPSVSESALSELKTEREQIRLLENSHSSVKGDMGIGESMLALKSSSKNGNLSGAAELSSKLTALVSVRASGGNNTEEAISKLKEKEKEILSSFGTASATAKTTMGQSGWYYSAADGYENIFTPDSAEGISPAKLDELINSTPEDVSRTAGRIVHTYRWYIATVMESSDASYFSEGDITEVILPGFTEPVSLTVESTVNGPDGRTAVVFSCGIVYDGYDAGRHLTIEFTINKVTGFGIPKEAVRIIDGITGVYTYDGVTVKFRKINIVAKYDELSIAEIVDAPSEEQCTEVVAPQGNAAIGVGRKDYEWLRAHEFIVVKGKSLYNGRIIG